tara:strand:- start:803 stop:1417 length:615 start_codon:yes stop_codon:yes gene_type:complete
MKKIILALLLLVSTFQGKSQDTTVTTYLDRLLAMETSEVFDCWLENTNPVTNSLTSIKNDPNSSVDDYVKSMDSKYTKYPWYFDDLGGLELRLEDSIKLVMGFDFSDKSKFKEVSFSVEGYENFPPRINQISCTWIISEEGGTTQYSYTITSDGRNYEKVISYGLRNSSNKSSFKVCVLLELKDENGYIKDITECKRVYYSSLY